MINKKKINKIVYNYKHVIVVLFLMLVGILGLICSNKIPNRDISNIISQLSIAIFISGTLGTIDALFTKASLVELIFEKLQLNQCIQDTGLETIYCDLSDIPYAKYFKEAKSNITIHHIYGQTWTNTYIGTIEDSLKKKGNLEIEVLLLKPDSKFNNALDEHFNYKEGETKDKIEKVTEQWKSLKNRINEYDKQKKRTKLNRVKIYHYVGQPNNSIYLIDDRIVLVLTKTVTGRSTQLPAIILCDNNKEEGLFSKYKQELKEVIKQAKHLEDI